MFRGAQTYNGVCDNTQHFLNKANITVKSAISAK